MKWNLRMVAAQRDIWRPTQLLKAFEDVDFQPSLSKVAALWAGSPVTVRLDDLDKICAALDCTIDELMQPEPIARTLGETRPRSTAVGDRTGRGPRPVPRSGGRRSLPPN
ncbi:helix-turn-helix domain-containing protein [Prescottella equi]|uniref:helix-turn-helix domain-containing protein n=1 Tax=Rhodococcus hoagii TaxID=43767 RepID=UPI000A10FBA6|nr:helix-turn-helix transcriptional regulator [Prescottella equi]ORL81633.1 XRE family transcriptional regulator [Prescottella equi]